VKGLFGSGTRQSQYRAPGFAGVEGGSGSEMIVVDLGDKTWREKAPLAYHAFKQASWLARRFPGISRRLDEDSGSAKDRCAAPIIPRAIGSPTRGSRWG